MGTIGVIWRFIMRRKRTPINSEEERLERRRLNGRLYNQRHKEQIRAKRTRYIEKNFEKYLWSVAKQSAKAREIPFDIVASDIIIPTHCIYLGRELTNIIGEYKGKVPTNASLDRIDSSKGYTKDNIQVISSLANKLKNNASEDILVAFAIGILKRHKNIDVSLE